MSGQLQIFKEKNYQPKSICSPSEALVKISQFLAEIEQVWEGKDQALSLKQFGSLGNVDQEFLYGRMLKELSPQTLAKILRQSSKRLPTLGAIDLNGNCLIHRGFQELPKTENAYTLSDILQPPNEVGEEFFLSEKAQKRILTYRDNKEIPVPLHKDTDKQTETDRTLLNVNSMHKKQI